MRSRVNGLGRGHAVAEWVSELANVNNHLKFQPRRWWKKRNVQVCKELCFCFASADIQFKLLVADYQGRTRLSKVNELFYLSFSPKLYHCSHSVCSQVVSYAFCFRPWLQNDAWKPIIISCLCQSTSDSNGLCTQLFTKWKLYHAERFSSPATQILQSARSGLGCGQQWRSKPSCPNSKDKCEAGARLGAGCGMAGVPWWRSRPRQRRDAKWSYCLAQVKHTAQRIAHSNSRADSLLWQASRAADSQDPLHLTQRGLHLRPWHSDTNKNSINITPRIYIKMLLCLWHIYSVAARGFLVQIAVWPWSRDMQIMVTWIGDSTKWTIGVNVSVNGCLSAC